MKLKKIDYMDFYQLRFKEYAQIGLGFFNIKTAKEGGAIAYFETFKPDDYDKCLYFGINRSSSDYCEWENWVNIEREGDRFYITVSGEEPDDAFIYDTMGFYLFESNEVL